MVKLIASVLLAEQGALIVSHFIFEESLPKFVWKSQKKGARVATPTNYISRLFQQDNHRLSDVFHLSSLFLRHLAFFFVVHSRAVNLGINETLAEQL